MTSHSPRSEGYFQPCLCRNITVLPLVKDRVFQREFMISRETSLLLVLHVAAVWKNPCAIISLWVDLLTSCHWILREPVKLFLKGNVGQSCQQHLQEPGEESKVLKT